MWLPKRNYSVPAIHGALGYTVHTFSLQLETVRGEFPAVKLLERCQVGKEMFGGGGNLFPGGIIQCVRVCEKTDETEPSECCVFRKQRLCCHGQHDDCDGVRHDHLVSGVTEPETNRLW